MLVLSLLSDKLAIVVAPLRIVSIFPSPNVISLLAPTAEAAAS